MADKKTIENLWWGQISYRLLEKLNVDVSAQKSRERYISRPIFVEAESMREAKSKMLVSFYDENMLAREAYFYDSIPGHESPYQVEVSVPRKSDQV